MHLSGLLGLLTLSNLRPLQYIQYLILYPSYFCMVLPWLHCMMYGQICNRVRSLL